MSDRLRELSKQDLLPVQHKEYLRAMRDIADIEPKVIYDIGASVLHWTRAAKEVWPSAKYVAIDAHFDCKFLYEEEHIENYCAVLSTGEEKDAVVDFWWNADHPGGCSYYQENLLYSPDALKLYKKISLPTCTLDWLVQHYGIAMPDLIKMDIQGAELDVLKGATKTLKSCEHLILELQKVEYNIGAPLADEVISYLDTIGFVLVTPEFSDNGVDGDYHFARVA